jgi:NADPH:quinone reductase-like Zn-dependent oxidoreductase
MIPGIDGVGRRADGRLIYFATENDVIGTMADKAIVDPRRSVDLPDHVDVAKVAAAMNPAMSSWVALRQRASFSKGQDVLVLGATGNAGQMAVQIARLFGAGQIVAVGRDAERLAVLPSHCATSTVRLDRTDTAGRLAQSAADVDVVLDYLWGEPAAAAIVAILTHRANRGRPLTWRSSP